jgi:hypothetical protein
MRVWPLLLLRAPYEPMGRPLNVVGQGQPTDFQRKPNDEQNKVPNECLADGRVGIGAGLPGCPVECGRGLSKA